MSNENSCSRIRIITRITAATCLAGMLLSYKLWINERHFPVIPVFDFIPVLPNLAALILALVCGVLLLLIVIQRNPQPSIFIFLGLGLVLCLLDINRWQPWFYQYFLMFFVLAFFNFRCDDIKKQNAIITVFKIMTAAVYFWSGLQKLNPHFLSDTFPWLMEPITNHMGPNGIAHFKFLGYAFPLLETGTGICLLIPALQRPAMIAAISMHCFILFSLGPLGHNYNPVVWPWNIAMILFVIILFYKEEVFSLSNIQSALHFHTLKLVVILFALMPLFNFFNCWDSYLSHNLYSGNTSGGVIYVSDSVKNSLPAYLQPYAIGEMNQNQINIKYWCMMELGVPAYPEKRNFEALTGTLHKYVTDPKFIYLLYTPKLKLSDLNKIPEFQEKTN